MLEYYSWYTANLVNISIFNALSIGIGLVVAVLICMKRDDHSSFSSHTAAHIDHTHIVEPLSFLSCSVSWNLAQISWYTLTSKQCYPLPELYLKKVNGEWCVTTKSNDMWRSEKQTNLARKTL